MIDSFIHVSFVSRAILNAHLLDALQVKLPKAVDIKRPGWNYPRVYGLPRWRRKYSSISNWASETQFIFTCLSLYYSVQLLNKMFHTIDATLVAQNIDVTQQQLTSEITIRAPMTLEGKQSLFETRQNLLVFGKDPLQPYLGGEVKAELLSKPLPDIYPLNRTISLHKTNIYRMESKFREFCH